MENQRESLAKLIAEKQTLQRKYQVPGIVAAGLLAGGFVANYLWKAERGLDVSTYQSLVVISLLLIGMGLLAMVVACIAFTRQLTQLKELDKRIAELPVQVRDTSSGNAKAALPSQSLQDLKKMMDDGLITKEEFEVKKAEILSRI